MDNKFDSLRRKMGSILGAAVPPGGFSQVVLKEDSQGRFASKQIILAIIAIYNYLEANDISKSENIQPVNE